MSEFVRNSDPSTSHAAAAAADHPTRIEVARRIFADGKTRTDEELARTMEIYGLTDTSARQARLALEKQGEVFFTGELRMTRYHREARCYRRVDNPVLREPRKQRSLKEATEALAKIQQIVEMHLAHGQSLVLTQILNLARNEE